MDAVPEIRAIYEDAFQRIGINHPGEFTELLRQHRFTTVVKPIESFHARTSELVVLKRVKEAGSTRVGGKLDTNQVH